MAYNHTEYEFYMLSSQGLGAASKVMRVSPFTVRLNATGNGTQGSAFWRPGYVPMVIRNAAVIGLGTAALITKPVISIRTTKAGATRTVSGNQIFSFTLTSIAGTKASATSGANVWYKSALQNTVVNPGTDVRAVITTKATQGPSLIAASIILYVEPKWETPGNVTNMKTG